ncbi:MAG: hypothetical protein QXF86_04475 [Candidatus Bilamarchaeaceae archaeon]
MVDTKGEYLIKKTEKGPLQRFKNQNLLLKKFGEVGLKIYRAITGKRTIDELKKDLNLEDQMFYPVIEYMKETEMVELIPVGGATEERAAEVKEKPKAVEKVERPKKEIEEEAPREVEVPEFEKEAEIAEEKEKEEVLSTEEEKAETEEESFFEEIEPIKPEKVEEKEKEEVLEIEKEETEEKLEEENVEESKEEREEAPSEEEHEEEAFEIEREKEEEFSFEEEPEESSVEKTIRDKYGDVGIQVYNLIDGKRTAEEIMNEVGISEAKLIEILDFLDKEGIIKLEYPGGKKAKEEPKVPPKEEIEETGFAPIVEMEKEEAAKEVTIPNPIEIPMKLPIDIVKSIQINANLLLKFKDDGKKVFSLVNGQNDVIDIALKTDLPLQKVYEILNYLGENAMVILKPMTRDLVKKKYGDDAFTIYKRYGREGVMLYELIGKDLSFKEMVSRTTNDKQRALDIFVFIHEVLGIELPLDKEILAKQIGL